MDKKMVFLWQPYLESELPIDVRHELHDMETIVDIVCDIEPYESFSWDNEDNESYPAIAAYVSSKYNEYFFFIDMHSRKAQ